MEKSTEGNGTWGQIHVADRWCNSCSGKSKKKPADVFTVENTPTTSNVVSAHDKHGSKKLNEDEAFAVRTKEIK